MTYEDMAALEALCFPQSHTWDADAFRRHDQDRKGILIHSAAGFVSGRVIADEAEIISVAVAPSERGKGLGREMLSDFLSELRKTPARSVFLEVASDNDAARRLYAHFGFTQAGLRKDYYKRSDTIFVDALILKLAL